MKRIHLIATYLVAFLIIASGCKISILYDCCRKCVDSCCSEDYSVSSLCSSSACDGGVECDHPTATFENECCANGCIVLSYSPDTVIGQPALNIGDWATSGVVVTSPNYSYTPIVSSYINTPVSPPLPPALRLALYSTYII